MAVPKTELDRLVANLSALLRRGVGEQSIWALTTCDGAIMHTGCGGDLLIRVPANPKDYPECAFYTGSFEVPILR